MTHKDNINNIIKHGILNHDDARSYKVNLVDISDPEAQRWRERPEPCYKRRIHDYAPLYINPRNPMLSARRHLQDDLCLLEVSLTVLARNEYLITDGNAASRDTQFYSSINDFKSLPWDVLDVKYWADLPDGKRKRCAEVLIYPKISQEFIGSIHCYSNNTVNSICNCGRDILLNRELFF
jgi:hypothetical protein